MVKSASGRLMRDRMTSSCAVPPNDRAEHVESRERWAALDTRDLRFEVHQHGVRATYAAGR